MPTGTPKNGINPSWFKKGHKVPQEWRNSWSKKNKGHKPPKSAFKKGIIPWNKGKKGTYKIFPNGRVFTKEWRKKMSEAKINHPNRIFKDTKIELKIEAELKRRNINYQKQVPLCKVARVDFYLPEYRTVIQCDGDYWHNLPKQKEKDERQNKVLTFNGFNVYRFWEYEINNSAQKCIDIIWKTIF